MPIQLKISNLALKVSGKYSRTLSNSSCKNYKAITGNCPRGLQAIPYLAVNSVYTLAPAWRERREMAKMSWNIEINKQIAAKQII